MTTEATCLDLAMALDSSVLEYDIQLPGGGKEKKEKKAKKEKEANGDGGDEEAAKKAKKAEKKKRKAEAAAAAEAGAEEPAKKKKKKKASKEAEPAESEEAKAKREKKEKKAAKKAAKAAAAPAKEEAEAAGGDDDEEAWVAPVKAAPAAATPQPGASARCFLGNLSYDITDEQVKEFFKEAGSIVDIHWLTDKESGQFYGSGFVEFSTAAEAATACGWAGADLNGRPLKIEISKPREAKTGGVQKKAFDVKPLGAKPEGCTTIFMGNLSYEIDDDKMKEFLSDCGEVAQIRWLTNRDTGEFKGCGFVDFVDTASVDKAAAKNGEYCCGRQCRIDFAESKKSW